MGYQEEVAAQNRKAVRIAIGAATAVVALLLFLFLNPLVIVHPGERGVVVRLGAVQDRILNEGIHFVPPLTQSVEKMTVQIQKMDVEAEASSKDLQAVHTTITLNFHLDPANVNKIYQTLRDDYERRVIAPAIQEYMKKATAMFTAEELVTRREAVRDNFQKSLSSSLSTNHIFVDNVFMTNFAFSDQFNRAIESKVTAEQNALAEKNNLAKAKFLADQRIASAEGEARAISIQARAITQQGGKDYVQLKAIEKWNGALPEQMIPGATVPFLDLTWR